MQTQPVSNMLATMAKRWWIFLVQGILMIALSYLAFTQPATLIQFVGLYALLEGVLKFASGFGPAPTAGDRWPALVIGGISVVVGVIILANPRAAAEVMTYLIAAWAVVVGVLLVLWGIRLRDEVSDEWLLIIFGILSLLFGLLTFVNASVGFMTLQWVFGMFMVTGGALAIVLAFHLRQYGERAGAVA